MGAKTLLAGLAITAGLALPAVAHAACEDLKTLALPDVKITAADAITPSPRWDAPRQGLYNGTATVPFCRVQGLIEGAIGFEVWLPKDFNGRLLTGGVGGDAGQFNYGDLARANRMGMAGATTDSGHKLSDRNWMMDRAKVENYEHRATHRTTVVAKALINAHYAKPVTFAYFNGCSGGGRQALKELQQYPFDYDGIIAGAPGPDMPAMSARHMFQALYPLRNPRGALTDADWNLVSTHATNDCDSLDGVKDGVVEDPRACRLNLKPVTCAGAKTAACITPDQARTVEIFSAPLRNEDGKVLDHGLYPGVRTRPGPPSPLLYAMFGQGVHRDLDWKPEQFVMSKDLPAAYAAMPSMRANNPDVAAFKNRGGKIIVYNGWLDPSVIAQQAIDYYTAVVAKQGGEAKTEDFMRLFMVPGMGHCRGGPGPDQFGVTDPAPIQDAQHDAWLAIMAWVEQGKAPDSLIASKIENGKTVRTRPLCPYPRVARYSGQGSTDEASNFTCVSTKRLKP